MARAVFLDRDGTIIEDTGYVAGRERVRLLPGSAAAIKRLNAAGFRVIVVTNQAGVARGYFDEDMVRITNHYIREVLAEQEAIVDGFYYCPHHVEGVVDEYRRDCDCRKPKPGMIERGARDFDIDLAQSFVVGDHYSDIAAGQRAGCRTVLLGDGDAAGKADVTRPDRTARDLPEAVDWILQVSLKEAVRAYETQR